MIFCRFLMKQLGILVYNFTNLFNVSIYVHLPTKFDLLERRRSYVVFTMQSHFKMHALKVTSIRRKITCTKINFKNSKTPFNK